MSSGTDNPGYAGFFGVMGATSAMVFSGRFVIQHSEEVGVGDEMIGRFPWPLSLV